MDAVISRRAILASAFALGLARTGAALAEPSSFKVSLSGAQSVPPVDTSGTGAADLTYDSATRTVTWNITYSGLSSPVTMAHFHGPAKEGQNGPVVIWLTKQGAAPTTPVTGSATLNPEQAQQFTTGEWYINVHSQSHPAGEIRGQVVPPKS
jgi:hypothetical protein